MAQYSSSRPGTQPHRQLKEKEPPSGIVSIRDILEERVPVGRMASVMGLVKDMRAPMATRGTDWKCTLIIYDKSTEEEYEGICGAGLIVNIFRPRQEMPEPNAGDVVLVTSGKVNRWEGALSLITHRSTQIYVFSASAIPKPPLSAAGALQPNPRKCRSPTEKECEYASWLYHAIDKYMVPVATEFEARKEKSMNIKEKFRTLDTVGENQFCDMVVQVVKDPWDDMDKVNLWLTDYTENEGFFKFSWDGSDMPAGRDGDPFGYVTSDNAALSRSWPGPFGRRAMQLTCYEPHATRLRDNAKAGDWIRLRNVQIKYGRNGHNLEGFLREDRTSFGSKDPIDFLDASGAHGIDHQLKDAIRRKLEYERAAKQQKKSYAAAKQGAKRKADNVDDAKPNAGARRAAKRAAEFNMHKQVAEKETMKEAALGLNQLVKCESIDQPVHPLSAVLEPVTYRTTIDEDAAELTLPFTNAKYRTVVRVVDYRPRKLEDFATWRKVTEYDMVSDYEGDLDSESDDNDQGNLDRFRGRKTWEWCFALQLEEAGHGAGTKGPPEQLWALVDNSEGQQLTNLNACDLRENPEEVAKLSEQLFKLWGNLQEHREQEMQAQAQSRRRLAANRPPDSSDNEDNDDQTGNTNKPGAGTVSNKPFYCCLRQYGIEVSEPDPQKCNAREGKRYERMFGLFGTKIC